MSQKRFDGAAFIECQKEDCSVYLVANQVFELAKAWLDDPVGHCFGIIASSGGVERVVASFSTLRSSSSRVLSPQRSMRNLAK